MIINKESSDDKKSTTSFLAEGLMQVGDFQEGLAKVWNEEQNYGFVDENYMLVIPTKYEFAEDFKEGLAVVRNNGEFGYINKEGKEIIPIHFSDAQNFSGGKAKVKKNGIEYFIDKRGEKLN